MNYNSFCETLKQMLLSASEENSSVLDRQIQKNNGLVYDTLCILRPGERCSPAIYLNPLYEAYKQGMPLQEILSHITEALEHRSPLPDGLLDSIRLLDSVRDRIVFCIVSKKQNEKLLSDIPWIPYLDLAIVFYLYLGVGKDGQMTVLIHNSQKDSWGVSTETLLKLAKENTPALFPASLCGIEDAILGAPETREAGRDLILACRGLPRPSFFVLTNSAGLYGASCLLYDGVIKDFARRMKSDLVVLPSSVHEVLLLADSGSVSHDSLNSMVRQVNAEEVDPEDRLSDHIYLYSRSTKSLTLYQAAPDSCDTP